MKAFIKSLKRPGNETLIEAIITGYNIIFEDQIKGGKADKKKPSDFDPEELKMGIKIEHEHTNDKKLAEEIAMDHLTEFPNYYTELKKMEKSLNEAIGPVYHGTNDKFEKFDLDKTTMGDLWFNSNKEIIERGDSGARGTKYIMERYLNIPEEKLAGWDLYEKRGLCELRNMGYKGVKLPSEEGIDYIVFNPKDIIKKPKNIMESIGPVYHGSPNKFDKFSYDHMGRIGTSAGYGFYFVTDKEIAEKYAEGSGNLYTAYIDINKPLNPTKKTITKKQLVEFLKALDPTGQEYLSNWGDVMTDGYDKALRKAVEGEYNNNFNDVDLISSIINGDGRGAKNIYPILTKTLGYDGIIAQPDWVGEHKLIIPFSPDQIKLVK